MQFSTKKHQINNKNAQMYICINQAYAKAAVAPTSKFELLKLASSKNSVEENVFSQE